MPRRFQTTSQPTAVRTPTHAHPPSTYQQAIYDFVADSTGGSAIVIAVAGSGKTSTIIEALQYIPPSQSVYLLAFNRAIAMTLKDRLPPGMSNVEAATFHAVGHRGLCSYLGVQLEPQAGKVRQILRTWNDRDGIEFDATDYRVYGYAIAKLVSYAKANGFDVPDVNGGDATFPRSADIDEWWALVDHFDVEWDYRLNNKRASVSLDRHRDNEDKRVLAMCQAVLAESVRTAADEASIDYDDQIYLPLLWKDVALTQRDWVIVDEAQDTNPVRRVLVRKILKLGGRLIAIGDPHQAIYGFTGASVDALDRLKDTHDCRELPLSVCYRCATSIVERAKAIVPQIEAAPGAIAGEVRNIRRERIHQVLTAQDAVLCRTTVPLVKLAYHLLGLGVKCQVLGRDFGKGLTDLIEKQRGVETAGELLDALDIYRTKKVRTYKDRDDDEKIATLDDQIGCVKVVLADLDDDAPVDDVHGAIQVLFADTVEGKLTLTTIHRAKGQEWNQVAFLYPEIIPVMWAVQDWELQQETNLIYVATTRAKERLFLVPLGGTDEDFAVDDALTSAG